MRLPLILPLDVRTKPEMTKTGLGNALVQRGNGVVEKGVTRPGLVKRHSTSGAGHGLVSFNGELLSVYGSELTFRSPNELEVLEAEITWGAVSPLNQYSYVLAEGNGLVVSTLFTDTAYAISSDEGVTFTAETATFTPTILSRFSPDIVFFSGQFWVVCNASAGGAYLYSSPDGVNWAQKAALPAAANVSGLYYAITTTGDLLFLNALNAVYATSDGTNWTTTNASVDFFAVPTIGDDKKKARLHYASSSIQQSTNGITWTAAPWPTPEGSWEGLVYANGVFYLIDGQYPQVYRSTDLRSWDLLGGVSYTIPSLFADLGCFAVNSTELCVIWDDGSFVATAAVYSFTSGTWRNYKMDTSMEYFLSPLSYGFVVAQVADDGFLETVYSNKEKWRSLATLEGSFFDFTQSTL